MDENTWGFAQLMMWLIGIQTTVLIAAFGGMWIAIGRRFEGIEKRLDNFDKRQDKMDEKIIDIDKCIFAIETMLHMKDCCMLKDDRQIKNAE